MAEDKRCFTKMPEERKRKGIKRKSKKGKLWKTSEEVMDWWLEKLRWK